MTTIAFDGVCFGDGPATGVARAFADALAAFAAVTEHDVVLLLPADVDGGGDSVVDGAGVRTVSAPRGTLRRQRELPALLRTIGADLLHSSVASVPLRASCPTIATAHDLPWLHPALDEPGSVWRRFATRRFLRAATRIVAPSAMTAADVERLLGHRCPPVARIPHGTALGPVPDAASVDRRAGPLLVLGDDRPRKNRDLLRDAHALAKRSDPGLPELEWVGPADRYLDETDKRARLSTCRAVVHVSRFEGFGMPVLEGLAHGAPVLCSDLPPHREISGGHAVLVDPDDVAAIAAGLLRIHRDEELRRRLAAQGHERAATMQPEHVAGRWTELHTEVLAEVSVEGSAKATAEVRS